MSPGQNSLPKGVYRGMKDPSLGAYVRATRLCIGSAEDVAKAWHIRPLRCGPCALRAPKPCSKAPQPFWKLHTQESVLPI